MKKAFLCLLAGFMLLINPDPTISKPITNNTTQSNRINTDQKSIDNLVGNYPNEIKTVFSDIDGTLLPFDKAAPRGELPLKVKIGSDKLKKAQIPLFLATGRSSKEAILFAKNLGYKNTYVIAQQGAEITDLDGHSLYQDDIKNKDAKKMLCEINNFNKKNNTHSKWFLYYKGNAFSQEKFTPPFILDKVTVLPSIYKLNKGIKPTKIAIYNENAEELRAIQAYLKPLFPNYHVDISSFCYCDISSLTATKGNAIKKLSELLKIDLKYTAVLGDAENDISMFKLVKSKGGVAIAVGNAMPIVKDNADYVTSSVKEDGFEKAVDKILLNNSKKVKICK